MIPRDLTPQLSANELKRRLAELPFRFDMARAALKRQIARKEALR